jgi:hypothetical protein
LYLRDERVVSYVPHSNYLGPDFFTYCIYDGITMQQHVTQTGILETENQVTMHVRNCRPVDYMIQFNIKTPVHPLCVCASTESSLVGNSTLCNAARISQCELIVPNDEFETNLNTHFLNMCLSCVAYVPPIGATNSTNSSLPVENQRGLRGTYIYIYICIYTYICI